MSPRIVFWLSVVGLAIGGSDVYWQIHMADPITLKFWIGMVFAGVAPVGSYFVGLSQIGSRSAAKEADKAALKARLDAAAGR